MAFVWTGDEETHISYFRGIVALTGCAVDRVAEAGLAYVPEAWHQQRRGRDGDEGFHVTVFTKADLQLIAQNGQDAWPEGVPQPDFSDLASIAGATAKLVAQLPGGLIWSDAGEGRASDGESEAAFRVVLWPAGVAARRALGLAPHDFHITLGFRSHDVHGKCKGLASLPDGTPTASAVSGVASVAKQLVEVGAGRGVLSEEVEELARAALQGAQVHTDPAAEAMALRALCTLCGRAQKTRDVLMHSTRLMELDENDEFACRSRAVALMALQRYADAFPLLGRLRSLVARLPESSERSTVEKWLKTATDKCKAKLGTADNIFPGSEEMATPEGDQAFEDAFLTASSALKFPSTSHLKNLGAATRDDKVCDAVRQKAFCGGTCAVSVEEKIDGANLGISLDHVYQFRMQNRSKQVNWNTDPQFAGLEQWLEEHRSTLCEILERNNDILFGEWCAYRHTVKYNKLPGYFLAFDIYDKRVGRFLSRQSFHTRLKLATGPKIPAVPTLCTRRTFTSVEEVEALLNQQSAFADGFVEGVYLRIDAAAAGSQQETYLEDRCKLVRSDFQQAIEDEGFWRGRGKNFLDMDAVMSYTGSCYPCALTPSTASASSSAAVSQETSAASQGKYPSTPHLPFSPGVNPDDTRLADCGYVIQDEVVVTEKLDGGNCCIKDGQVYARTHSQPATHESFSTVKQLLQCFAEDLSDIELFGENMQAVHSIEYGNLTSFFYVFGARRRDRDGEWLPWDDVVALAERLGLPTAPLVFRGRFESTAQLQASLEAWSRECSAVGENVSPEGFVVRRAHGFASKNFGECMAKYVRANHIQTDDAFKRKWKKAQFGPSLPPRSPRRFGTASDLRMKVSNPRETHKVTTPGFGEVVLPRNFSFLMDELAVSSTPKRRDQIVAMASMGITLVVTLTEETPLPGQWFAGTGVRNMFVPVPNYHPPTVPQIDEILEAVAEAVRAGGKVMEHCGGGKGRAGTVAACILMRFGTQSIAKALGRQRGDGAMHLCPMQSDEVIAYLRDMRPGSIETEHQERFVREFSSILWRRSAEAPAAPALLRSISEARSEHEQEGLLEAQVLHGHRCTLQWSTEAEAQQALQIAADSAHCGSSQKPAAKCAKSSRDAKEAQKRLKAVQKRAPKYIMMVGLAGSGKSTFSRTLEATGLWVRANQDDLGRKGCEDIVKRTVPMVRQGKCRLVVDRCNLRRQERAEWLDLMNALPAKEVACVFCDFSAEDCKTRAASRMDHPTIRAGGGGRIIDEQARQFERPSAAEGFGVVEVVRSFEEANALLHRYGADPTTDNTPGSHAPATSTDPASVNTEVLAVPSEQGAQEEDVVPVVVATWLREAVQQELSDTDAEGIFAAVEVILAGAASDPEAIASAAEVLRESGAPRAAADLASVWHAAGT